MRRFKKIFCLAFVLYILGCAHFPENAKLAKHDKKAGYRFENLSSSENSDSLFVILSFSGGGTRAAALSYGVLERLKNTEITWEGKKRRLLDEIDVISAVSGGSFTAAYYAIFGDKIFEEFESRFLKVNIERELTRKLFLPTNWFRLSSSAFDRIDMAAEYYDEHIFGYKTFKDLMMNKRRPFILINATDMTLGARFEFTQDQFDLLCSDLTDFPISRAVAASSAFPVLLSPITLNNYAGTCGFQEPKWVENALLDRDIAARRFDGALQMRSYQNKTERPYIHLLDGGIADNIGLRGVQYSVTSTDSAWSVLRMVNLKKIKKIVIVVVNAKTEPDVKFDRKKSAPSWKEVLMTTATAPMDNYSFETIESLNKTIVQWKKDVMAFEHCKEALKKHCPEAKIMEEPLADVEFYPVVIGFNSLKDTDERTFFANLPTSFNLPPETIDSLKTVGARLLNESGDFQRLLKDLK